MKYSLSSKEVPRAKLKGFPDGSGYIALYIRSHNTDILNYNTSIVLPGRARLEELILRIALAAAAIFSSTLPALLGMYCKYTPSSTESIFSSTIPVELNLYGEILLS